MDRIVQFRSLASRYGLAVFLVAVATAVRYALTPLVGGITPLLFFTLAQVAAALLAGRGPGILAIVLGTLVGYYAFLQPAGRLNGPEQAYYVILNVFVGLALVWMADAMHRSHSESRRSEAEARTAHERLTDLLSRIGDAYFSFDLQWRCLYANRRAAAMTGKDPSEMTGKTFQALMPGVFTETRAALLQQALKQNDFLALDGLAEPEGIWFELNAYPGPDFVSVFLRDVTDRKSALMAIAQSEEHFRRIFDDSPVGMIIVGLDGRFIRVNNAMCRMLECPETELVGKPITELSAPEDFDALAFFSPREHQIPAASTDGSHRTHMQMETRFVTKSGKVLWTNLNASVLRERGEHRYFLGIIENITERKQVEEQLRESQKLESLGVLAGGIAHDFNNLLTGILGNASLSLDLTPPDSPLRPLLQRLVQASERAADLTRQLLAYAGKGRFVISALSMSEMVKEISSLVRATFPSHVRLELDLATNMAAIEADPAQIQQIVMNLLLNAAESIPADREGVVKVCTFELSASEEHLRSTVSSSVRPPAGKYAVLEVADNGSGIDPATQARIFEPFFTTKFTGRGLGLSAVLGIVTSYKGAVSVQSKVGSGTKFRVFLPATAKTVEVAAPRPAIDIRGSDTILVVDDEQLVLSIARSALERSGYTVLTATSGHEAIDLVQKHLHQIAAVILDLTMPGMNGEEAFRCIKGIRSDLPVIVCTGHSEAEIASRFAGAGIAGILQKPYSAAQLAEKIKSTLQPL